MNRDDEVLNDDARFDRLVDGELSAADYHTLLTSLDDEPGGWRRLAQAFLEAQALGGELNALRRELQSGVEVDDVGPLPVGEGARVANRSVPARLSRWSKWLALAACWLVMFGLGVVFDRELAKSWTSRASGPTFVQRDPLPKYGDPGGRHVVGRPTDTPETLLDSFVSDQPIGSLNLVLEGEGASESPLVVPVYRADARGVDALANTSALSPEILRELERRGHTVRRQQELVPLDLENGQQAIVPVEKFEIVPVSYRPY